VNKDSIKEVATISDRYKICVLLCSPDNLLGSITFVQSENINVLNIGKELASYIDALEDYRYLNIDVYDYTKSLLDKHKSKIYDSGNEIIAIYNLGILLEPELELNTVQLLKEFSKSTALIIIWENQSEISDRLNWPTQKQNFFLDFSDTILKKLQYAI